MNIDFLERLLKLLEKLEVMVLEEDTKKQGVLLQQIERHIGSFEHFVDTLRQCESEFGCHNDHTKQTIECASTELSQYHKPTPALWYYNFAHEKFLSELKRWIKEDKKQAEREGDTKKTIGAVIISLLLICIFVLSVWLIPFTPFTWLKNHPKSFGIQGSIICLILCLIFGFFKPGWRKYCWGTAAIAFLAGLLQLL